MFQEQSNIRAEHRQATDVVVTYAKSPKTNLILSQAGHDWLRIEMRTTKQTYFQCKNNENYIVLCCECHKNQNSLLFRIIMEQKQYAKKI